MNSQTENLLNKIDELEQEAESIDKNVASVLCTLMAAIRGGTTFDLSEITRDFSRSEIVRIEYLVNKL